MAKWGNALGGYRTQRRDGKGRFSGGGKTSKTAKKYGVSNRSARKINRAVKRGATVRQTTKLTDSRGRASRHGKTATITEIRHSSKSRAHEKNRKNLKRAGVQLAVGAAVTYAVHKGHNSSAPAQTIPSRSVKVPSGSVSRPIDFGSARLDVGSLMGIATADPLSGRRARR